MIRPVAGLALAASVLLAAALAALVLAAGAGQAQDRAPDVALIQVWRLGGLRSPESLLLGADGAFFYVANVSGEGDAKDGNGHIAKVSRDGRLLQLEWAKGLDAPKGMALRGGRLFVADIDRVVELDAATGAIVKAHPVEGAKFLNDVAAAPDGRILAADSGTGRIFALHGGKVTVWLQHPDLRSINGLLAEPNRLMVTTMGGLLLAVDWRDKAVTRLAEGLGEGDGVAALGGGRYLVSEWPGRLFEVRADGSHAVVLDTRAEERYLNDFITVGDLLIVPHWKPGELTAYRLGG